MRHSAPSDALDQVSMVAGPRRQTRAGPRPLNPYRRALGAHVHLRADWDWWVTLTYRVEERRWERVERHVREWADQIARAAVAHAEVALCVEWQRRGALHVHALCATGQSAEVTAAFVSNAWGRGDADVDVFNPRMGAAWYLTKGDNWGSIFGCPRRPGCRRRHGCRWRDREVPLALP